MKYFIALFILSICKITYCQTSQTILGTYTAGCKIFNFEFKKAPDGIYSFKIYDIIKQDDQFYFDKDSINNIKKNLQLINDSLDILGSILESPNTPTISKKDSIKRVILSYQSLFEGILLDTLDLNFWNRNKDSIQLMIKNSESFRLNNYESFLLSRYGLNPYFNNINIKLRKIANAISDIYSPPLYYFNEFEEKAFTTLCTNLVNQRKLLYLHDCDEINISKKSEDIATKIFYQIKTKLDFIDDEPKTAYLKLKNKYINCFYSNTAYVRHSASLSEQTLIRNKFIVDKVSVEFEDGLIKNIFADLLLADTLGKPLITLPLRFKNPIPISISSRNDIGYFSNINVYVSDFEALEHNIIVKKDARDTNLLFLDYYPHSVKSNLNDTIKNLYSNIYLVLSDLIDYVDILESNKEDYSPVNSVVELNHNILIVELKKEKRSKIISIKAFTDLVGIQSDQPNGLIQIEASRKFNLLTTRRGFKESYYGWLTYLEPKLIFSKIENNNNTLQFKASDIDSLELSLNERKVYKTTSIKLFQFQNTAFSLDINIFKYNIPSIKSNFQFNIHAGILRTNVSDTLYQDAGILSKSDIPNNSILNTFKYGASILYELKPDGRFGITLGHDVRVYNLQSSDYYIPSTAWMNSSWIDTYLKTNNENMLFFRYKFTFVNPPNKNNFVQIQVGYMLNLFKT